MYPQPHTLSVELAMKLLFKNLEMPIDQNTKSTAKN